MFLMKAIQDKCLRALDDNDDESDEDVAFVIFNVKGRDLWIMNKKKLIQFLYTMN